MCWVMPPASPRTTSVERSASSRLVLPWSTWPMTVTTGGAAAGRCRCRSRPRCPARRRSRHAAGAVAELLHHQLGGVGVERLRDGRHHAHLHQRLHHVAGAGGHAGGQLLHGDGVGQHHVARDLQPVGAQQLQLLLAALAVALAADAGERAGLLVLALDGGLHVDAAVAAAHDALLGHGGRDLAGRQRHAGAATRRFLVLAGARGLQPQRLGRGRGRGAGVPAWPEHAAAAAGCDRAVPERGAGRAAAGGGAASAAWRARPRRLARLDLGLARGLLGGRAASSSRRRASSAADRMEIFSCSRRSISRRAASRFCSSSTRCRVGQLASRSARVRRRRRARRAAGRAGRRPRRRQGPRRAPGRPGRARASCAPPPGLPWTGHG